MTRKNSPLIHAASSLILNATKHLAGIHDNMHLLPQSIIDSMFNRKFALIMAADSMVAMHIKSTILTSPALLPRFMPVDDLPPGSFLFKNK
ncbi:MAG: DUF1846 family protein [Bacteroidia bacterium]|nr:DUF1846 family protein [Bacteroidia bacterium]